MLKRLLLFFIVILSFISLGYSAQCSFDLESNNCSKFSEPFNGFNIEFSQIENLKDFSAVIFNKENPSNIIQTKIEDNSIKNIVPFTEPAIYTLKINYFNRANEEFEKEFDFVFDNSKPLPPLVDINLTSTTNSILIEGNTNRNYQVFAVNENLEEYSTQTDAQGNYQLRLDLNSGINIYNFYNINSNGVKSEPNQRIIIFEDSQIVNSNSNNLEISNLENLNFRTYIENNKYITSKRNFLIAGKAPESLRDKMIYINGNPSYIDNRLNFAGFLLLNEGLNEVTIETDTQEIKIEVIYINPRFKFEEIEIPKIVSTNLEISGKSNFDVPFNLYLNGDFIKEVLPENGLFSESLSNLKEGKNYIYLEGLNGETIHEIVYKDISKPKIELLTPDKIAYLNKLVFKITDDTGIDTKDIEFIIGGNLISSDKINVSSDFYSIDIKNIEDGIQDYTLKVSDRAGNFETLNGVISIDKENTLIEGFNLRDGYFIGNSLFIKKGENQIVLSPSRYVAFKKIYLDGIEQNNYEIKENSNVYLNLNFEKEKGDLELNFVNSNLESFSFLIKYYTDDEEPKVNLDYIYNSYVSENGVIKVSGEIIDSHFNWESLKFNSKNNFLRFGNNFEAYILENNGNLEISGRDYSLNEIANNIYGGLIIQDFRKTDLEITQDNNDLNSLKGALKNNNVNIKNFIYTFDGFNTQNSYLKQNFNLPISQRIGLRSLNLNGVEQSGILFNNIETISVGNPQVYENNNVDFKIYFNGNDKYTKESNYFIQGQVLTNSDLTSVKIGNKNCEFDSYNFVCFVNLNNGENSFEIIATNENGETVSNSYMITKVENNIDNSINDISGYGVFKSGSIYFINLNLLDLGASVSKETINSLIIDSREILIGKQSGEFNLELDLENNIYGKNKDEIEISLKSKDEYGNEKISNKITLIYNRVLETILRVIVG